MIYLSLFNGGNVRGELAMQMLEVGKCDLICKMVPHIFIFGSSITVSGRSPFLFILDLCPATVKRLDVRKTLYSLCCFKMICPRGEMMVPVSVMA